MANWSATPNTTKQGRSKSRARVLAYTSPTCRAGADFTASPLTSAILLAIRLAADLTGSLARWA